MLSIDRNAKLLELAGQISRCRELTEDSEFISALEGFIRQYGGNLCAVKNARRAMLNLLSEIAQKPGLHKITPAGNPEKLKNKYLGAFPEQQRQWACDLLELARASWKLRNDDNIYLGRIEAQLMKAVATGSTTRILSYFSFLAR